MHIKEGRTQQICRTRLRGTSGRNVSTVLPTVYSDPGWKAEVSVFCLLLSHPSSPSALAGACGQGILSGAPSTWPWSIFFATPKNQLVSIRLRGERGGMGEGGRSRTIWTRPGGGHVGRRENLAASAGGEAKAAAMPPARLRIPGRDPDRSLAGWFSCT